MYRCKGLVMRRICLFCTLSDFSQSSKLPPHPHETGGACALGTVPYFVLNLYKHKHLHSVTS